MITINDLKTNLDKNKNAVIIIGPYVSNDYKTEEQIAEALEKFNRRTLVKNTKEFYEFFMSQIYQKNTNFNIELISLMSKIDIKSLYIFNTDSSMFYNNERYNIYKPLGNQDEFYCNKCRTTYVSNSIIVDNKVNYECEQCGNKLMPQILFPSKSIDADIFENLAKDLETTNCVITIGLDYAVLSDQLIDYCNIKEEHNAKYQKEGKIDYSKAKIMVGITKKDFNLNETIGFHEFLVIDNPEEAIERLNKSI